MIELLAPAGDLERLKIAYLYGADACYIGGKDYSLRANAKNFSLKEIKTATKYAHHLRKKIYVTVNIIFREENLVKVDAYLKSLKQMGIDAVIASDIVIVKKALDLGLEVILSTQASILNYSAINFWQSLGVKRFVLGREATRDDIKKILEMKDVSLECFIHGAMCTSISGKCILSNYLTGRDANRGGCAQICRWAFKTNGADFTFRSKDLNMVDYLEDMIDIGVTSFKVEGRMRSIYYIATVIRCYRILIDKISNHTLTEEDRKYYKKVLDRVANRDSIPQFYQKFPSVEESYFNDQNLDSNQDFLGIVLDYDKERKLIYLEERNYFKVGDIVEFIGPNMDDITYTIKTIYNENNEEIEVARHPQMKVYLPFTGKIGKYAMMRVKIFDK